VRERNGINLVDQSVFLARTVLLPRLWIYYMGAVPCVLYFLYFFHDMSANPDAQERLAISSGVLVLSLIWMKVWQSIFCLRSYETLLDTGPQKLHCVQLLRCIGWQTILGLLEIIVIPLSLLLTIPFGWCYAFFQNASMGPLVFQKEIISESIHLSSLWPKQNHLMLWILCPVSLFVMAIGIIATPNLISLINTGPTAVVTTIFVCCMLVVITLIINPFGGLLFINFFVAIVALPQLLRMLFGWETVYSMSPMTMLHPGFILTTWSLCFLCMDPLVKICYIARMYDKQAIRSGHDLLKKTGMAAISLLILLNVLKPDTVEAAVQQVNQKKFDIVVTQVLEKPSYSWREKVPLSVSDLKAKKNGTVYKFLSGIKKIIKKTLDWAGSVFSKIFKKPLFQTNKNLHTLPFGFKPLFVMILVVVVLLLVFLFIRTQLEKRQVKDAPAGITEKLTEDITSNTICAEDNPSDEWENLAKISVSEGDIKAAIRYLYLSTLSFLGERRMIVIRRSRSNREFKRELERRFPDKHELNEHFTDIISQFEYTWYGTELPAVIDLDKAVFSHHFIRDSVNQNA
jgi:hypothetical protein